MAIFVTSDLHFCHDRAFVYSPRGFSSVAAMNMAIVANWNSVVHENDDVYILGDLMLNNNELALEYINQLNGKFHIVFGNHDTDTRRELLKNQEKVVETAEAIRLKYKNYHFFLTHYPCITGSLEKEDLHKCTCNLFGHTHSKDKFFNDMPFMYNVAMDAHDCTPVLLDDIINDMEAKVVECLKQL